MITTAYILLGVATCSYDVKTEAPPPVHHISERLVHTTGARGPALSGIVMADADSVWMGQDGFVARLVEAEYGPALQRVQLMGDGARAGDAQDFHVVVLSDDEVGAFDAADHLPAWTAGPIAHQAIDARATLDGDAFVLVEGPDGCLIRTSMVEPFVELPVGEECRGGAGFDFDPRVFSSYVATERGVVEVDRDGVSTVWDGDGTMVSWGAFRGLLYTGSASTVRAWDEDGALRWSVEMEGTLLELVTADELEGVYVLSSVKGQGVVSWVSEAGESTRLGWFSTPVREIAVSPDGERLAVLTTEQVDVFRVRLP